MADSQIASLFMTPEMYQQAQNAQALERANAFAQLDPLQRAAQSMYYGGYQAGNAIGGALGAQDPQMQLASLRQSVLKGVDQADAGSLRKAAQALADAGDLQGANALAQQSVAIQAKIDEKQAALAQTAALAREKIQSQQQIAADRNALMAQIAQTNAALRGANSDIQRQLLEQRISDLQTKADEKKAQLQTQAQGRVAAFDSALDTLDVLASHPGKKDVVGAVTGGVRSMIPGTDAAGFAAQLETFKAQTFIPQVAALKGMGALSDAEGKKLTAAVGALDPKMKATEFDKQVAKIKADLTAARERAMNIPGVETTTTTTKSTGKTVKFSDLP